MTIVSLKKLTVSYDRVRALDNVTLDIPRGTTLVIGSNGSGKTTLLKVIAGLVKPSSGVVRVFGLNPYRDFAKVSSRLIFIDDSDPIPYMYRVRHYVELLAEAYGWDPVRYAVDVLGLQEHLEKRIGELSKGLRRRVSLLEALAAKSKDLLLLDEPLAGLDRRNRIAVSNAIRALSKGISVIVASHIPLRALRFNYLVVLESGYLVYSGAFSEQIVHDYLQI